MMFIKVHDISDYEYLLNTSHIIYIMSDGRVTNIGLDNKLNICVSETPDEILELLKAEDPLREKILAQMDDIDNMLDNMEKKDPWEELMRRLADENKN